MMTPKILIVDDDEQSRKLLALKMEADNYDFACAVDGLDALEKLKVFHPDLILTDLMMPRMNGYSLLKELKSKESTRYIPVLMITAVTDTDEKIKGLELGADDFINKPYNMFEVSARIGSFLRSHGLAARLRESEKMASFGVIVDGIAHELRNPLSAIGGLTRRLVKSDKIAERDLEYAQMILSSVERMERMVDRISDFKKVLVSKRRQGALNQIVLSVVEQLRSALIDSNVDIELDLCESLPGFEMDASSLKIAILNIVQNSIEAIEGKGWIRLQTSYEDKRGGIITLKVIDSGHGMDSEIIDKVFNPFQSSKMTGAGLGLTISSRVIGDLGGTIDIKSDRGKGCTFTIEFPLSSSTSR